METANRERPIQIKFRVDENELDYIKQRQKYSGCKNMSQYLRKVAIHSKIEVHDFSELRKLNKEINAIGRNINQIAARLNSLDRAYDEDVKEVKERMEQIWQLLRSIDECIMSADSFGDFLGKMQERGYEIKRGKYISFRAEGQERFTHTKTLGFYYTEENIRFRIDRRLMYREEQQLPKDNLRFVQATEKIKSSEGLQRWAMLQSMQSASKLLNELTERNIESKKELNVKLLGLYDDRLDVTTEIKSVEKGIDEIEHEINIIGDYLKLKPMYKQFKGTKDPDKFHREHESDLRLFESRKKAVKPLLKDNGKLPNVQDLKKRLAELNEHKAGLMKQYGGIKSEITKLERLKKDLEKYERSVPQKEKVNEME